LEADAILWQNDLVDMTKERDLLKETNTKREQLVTSLEQDLQHVTKGYVSQGNLLDKTYDRAQRAEKRDILGGGLPWFITGLVVALGVGFGLGFWAAEAGKP
jgi:hypothetical protein